MGSRKSEKAIVEHVFVNFRVKNAVFTNFRDKNAVFTSFRDKNCAFELHDKTLPEAQRTQGIESIT